MRKLYLITTLLCLLAVPVHAQEAARSLVQDFYKEYQQGEGWQKSMPGNNQRLSTELYELLNACVDNGPEDGFWLDFDPFINAQMNAAEIVVKQPRLKGSYWYVPVEMSYRSPGHLQPAVTVVVGDNAQAQPRILNFVYPARDGAKSWDLKSFLKQGLGK